MMALIQQLIDRVETQQNTPAIQIFREGKWKWYSWGELLQQVQAFAWVLKNLGITRGNRVGILAESGLEWIVADLACHYVKAVSVPLSTQISQRQLESQMDHSGLCLLLVDDVNRVTGVKFGTGVSVMNLGDSRATDEESIQRSLDWVGCWPDLKRHAGVMEGPLPMETCDPTRISTIMYTSGTTDSPKGVMLTEGNLMFNSQQAFACYGFDSTAHQYSFLPFFHAFARTCDLYVWLCGGHRLSLASARKNTIQDLAHVCPTHINGVPHYFHRLRQAALECDHEVRVWGDLLEQVNCGGAALSDDLYMFYETAGIAMLEGYGLTETSPVASLNTQGAQRMGSVGKALAETELRIDVSGEIQIRGPHVMAGYYRDSQQTQAAYDDGWLKTGDLGYLDDEGFLFVTGRETEMIVTSRGQNVWPGTIEMELAKHAAIGQAVVFGDGSDDLVALICPDWDHVVAVLDLSGSPKQWVGSPQVENWFLEIVQQQLSALARHEQIAKVALIESPLTAENDMLTPKGTLRRCQIATVFEDVLKRLYSGSP